MELVGIAILAAGLMGAWHVTKHAVPRTMRAVGQHRSQAVTAWRADHPGAPTITRWAATLAKTFAALRWGPRYLARETGRAWREGIDAGRSRYGMPVATQEGVDRLPETNRCTRCGHGGSDYNPLHTALSNGETLCGECLAKVCVRCNKNFAVEGDIACAECRAWQDKRNEQAPSLPRPRPHLRPVPNQPVTPEPKENKTVAIETATGGEITNAEQFYAEAQAIVREATADLEDAAADNARAQEDLGRVEKMIASLRNQRAVASDITAVAGLQDPAASRAEAAKVRLAAAEQRLAGAKAVEQIAAKHVQLIGQATGPFYNAA